MVLTPELLIESLRLSPHPEGGWYRELHRSDVPVRRCVDDGVRAGLTVIAFLLLEGECSRWHRVAAADEVWHHAAGAPLDLWCLPPRGGTADRHGLGPLGEARSDQLPLRIVPAGWWQAARSRGPWTLSYCCVGPGFAFEDFRLMADLAEAERPAGALPDLL